MSLVIFAFGVLVFLITVCGTVLVGGLFLTNRQLDEQPRPRDDADAQSGLDRARALIRSKY